MLGLEVGLLQILFDLLVLCGQGFSHFDNLLRLLFGHRPFHLQVVEMADQVLFLLLQGFARAGDLGDVGVGRDEAAGGQRVAFDLEDRAVRAGPLIAVRLELAGQGQALGDDGLNIPRSVFATFGLEAEGRFQGCARPAEVGREGEQVDIGLVEGDQAEAAVVDRKTDVQHIQGFPHGAVEPIGL